MEMVAPLLAAGADPDARTPSGKSARELAVINKKTKVVEAFDRHCRSVEKQDGARGADAGTDAVSADSAAVAVSVE
eukprot:2876801-Prymnesium_polylepis.1